MFPQVPGIDLTNLQMTDVGVYSVTNHQHNKQTINFIQQELDRMMIFRTAYITVLDATACVGGDTIGFSLYFNRVISIEKDPINYSALVNNINVYGLNNVTTINDDFLMVKNDVIDTYHPTIVYFDPPWGGKEYYKHKNLDLFLGNRNVSDIAVELFEPETHSILKTTKTSGIKLVVLKVPTNFNYDKLRYNASMKRINGVPLRVVQKSLKKFDLIFITPF